MPDEANWELLAAGVGDVEIRKANPRYYWAHNYGGAPEYYWDEVPVRREEYVDAVGEDLAA
jgi:hypothetical protein